MKIAYIATAARVDDSYRHSSEHLFKYSGGNTGNFAFVHAISTHLGDEFDLLPWHVSPHVVKHKYDLVIIACANQLGSHTDLGGIADNLEKMQLPIVAIGLGAQAGGFEKDVLLKDGTKRWIEVIAAHSPSSKPNIGVRGKFSHRQLELLGFGDRAVVTGCPSNLINCREDLPRQLKAKYKARTLNRIAVPAGLHLWTQLKPLEQQLAKIVEETRGAYVAQSELDMIRLGRGELDDINPDTLRALNDYIFPTLSPSDFATWCRRHATCYIDATSWLEAMRNFDFVIGPRFHGVMLAIQAGTPGGVIAHDSRTYEMCETMCIPVRHYRDINEPLTSVTVQSIFDFDDVAYARRRLELGAGYAEILRAAGVTPSKSLATLIDTPTQTVRTT